MNDKIEPVIDQARALKKNILIHLICQKLLSILFHPLTVCFNSCVVKTDYKFQTSNSFAFAPVALHKLTWGAVFAGMGLGFSLSLLFFMDQNISSAMVNNPGNRCCLHAWGQTFKLNKG